MIRNIKGKSKEDRFLSDKVKYKQGSICTLYYHDVYYAISV